MIQGMAAMPFIASAWDAGRNIGKSWNYGYDLPSNIGRAAKYGEFEKLVNPAMHVGSVGGALTAFGGAGIGALAGAAIGTQLPGGPVAQTALAGAALGSVAVPAAGLAARGGVALGGAAINAGKSLGMAAWNNAPAIGNAVMGAASSAASVAAIPAARYAKGVLGFGSSLVRWDMPAETIGGATEKTVLGRITNTGGAKLTGLGNAVLWGSTAVAGVAGAFREVNRQRMGQMDTQITTPTPRMQSAYQNNAGATGDLVFALNANRRG